MRRPTISDIARECGVSATAVSFALNGRPGVSDARRAQILAKAEELGWTPSAAARALSTSHVGAIGLIITAPPTTVSRDGFYMHLVAGIEKGLAGSPDALVLKVVGSLEEELAALRTWRGESRVDAVLLVNPHVEDPRPALLARIGLPAVFLGDTREHPGTSCVAVDDHETMDHLLRDVADQGVRSMAWVHTVSPFLHGRERLRALEGAARHGIEAVQVLPVAEDDEDAAAATLDGYVEQLVRGGLPDLILCEDELITLTVLGALDRRGLSVPGDVALASWESAPGLRLRPPAIASIERDPMEMGAAAVELVRETARTSRPAVRVLPSPRLVVRASLGGVREGYSIA